ncbi:transposase [Ferrovum sp. PN-J185]|uniref:transposase n=1 Tax=Ferrovum sp. PN-J185 TaxID=1356306 RepID=UPI00079ABD5C|nr:transposase [Ferrovum sp. PN-J185]KXW55191.1 transposase [Ferrovum sp. PN-J185]
MKRTHYSAEFKAEAVKPVVEKGHSVVDVAKRLGFGEGLLYHWVRLSRLPQEPVLDDMKSIREENARLRAELKRTTEERDILKKATAYFAKQQG